MKRGNKMEIEEGVCVFQSKETFPKETLFGKPRKTVICTLTWSGGLSNSVQHCNPNICPFYQTWKVLQAQGYTPNIAEKEKET